MGKPKLDQDHHAALKTEANSLARQIVAKFTNIITDRELQIAIEDCGLLPKDTYSLIGTLKNRGDVNNAWLGPESKVLHISYKLGKISGPQFDTAAAALKEKIADVIAWKSVNKS